MNYIIHHSPQNQVVGVALTCASCRSSTGRKPPNRSAPSVCRLRFCTTSSRPVPSASRCTRAVLPHPVSPTYITYTYTYTSHQDGMFDSRCRCGQGWCFVLCIGHESAAVLTTRTKKIFLWELSVDMTSTLSTTQQENIESPNRKKETDSPVMK